MTKSELILRLAGRNEHLHRRDVEKVVDAVLEKSLELWHAVTG